MRLRNLLKLLSVAMLLLVLISVGSATTASVTVPDTRLEDSSQSITANDLKPAECASLNLTNIVTCPLNGTCQGTNANDLVLGSTRGTRINGNNGNDCILGGGGNDTLNGGNGTDVCIGGPGTDSFGTCETTYP